MYHLNTDKNMKHLVYIIGILFMTSCADFLDTAPYDSLSPSTTWKTESDAQHFAIACYSGMINSSNMFSFDCASDIAYNNFPWEGFRSIGDGTMTASNTGASFYSFTTIRRCNEFLENIGKVSFSNEKVKKDLIAQVRAIRAYKYFELNFWYGGVAIIDSYQSAEEAKVPRNTEENVIKYVNKELDELIPDLNEIPGETGRIAKATALAIKMRSSLYWGDLQRAKEASKAIIDMGKYSLDANYANLFTLEGKSSMEIIYAVQFLENTQGFTLIGKMYNNSDSGQSSLVPTQNLVDMYEMEDGLTKEQSPLYDPVHPFYKRDPRMAMTILYPGQFWKAKNKDVEVLNTLDQDVEVKDANGNISKTRNPNYPIFSNNASKTSLSWAKYSTPMDQYADIWNTSTCPIVFRYAEVLLTYAETSNELSGPSPEVYDLLDKIRHRVSMPAVDRNKYSTKETLRELIRRERGVELAGEGLRRADILRWKDANGKMLAETLLNGDLFRIVGSINYAETNPTKKAVINLNAPESERRIETRKFGTHNRYLPIPQESIDKNPNLKQNTGY